MRYLPLLLPLLAMTLAGCGANQSEASRIGERTYRIIGPEIAGGAEGPNRRMATQLCPGGFRKLESEEHKGGADRVDCYEHNITTIWVVRCL